MSDGHLDMPSRTLAEIMIYSLIFNDLINISLSAELHIVRRTMGKNYGKG